MADPDLDFSMMKKKKKKKKTPVDFEDEPAAAAAAATATAAAATSEEAAPVEEAAAQSLDVDNLDFSAMKKKKKKKKKPTADFDESGETAAPDDAPIQAMEGMDLNADKGAEAAAGDDDDADEIVEERDYTYQELLDRVFDIMRAKNPDMVTGEKRKFVLKPPQVVRIGAKKTSFVNFTEICKLLHRQPKHLLAFICAELGTSGSVDANNQLIIKGRYQQKQIESVLRRYIKEYVTCHTCRSPETMLQKETRLFFLQCESCGSRCSVASIKSGFQAVTSKRAAQRAKQQ